METEDAIPMGAGDFARDDDEAAGDEAAMVEVEHEGRLFQVPVALKGAFLRNADYTRKTQELAAQRREMEARRQAMEAEAADAQEQMLDRARIAALDENLASFEGVDWELYAGQDPEGARALWAQFQAFREARDRYVRQIAHRQAYGKLEAERALADRLTEAGRVLSREIEGWSPEVATKLVEYAQAFGVTMDEMRQVADPRLWIILHRAQQADEAAKRQETARAAEQAQAVRPAVQVSGAAASGGGVRDELGTAEWMQRRNAQMGRGR